jgi:hypothetical protein
MPPWKRSNTPVAMPQPRLTNVRSTIFASQDPMHDLKISCCAIIRIKPRNVCYRAGTAVKKWNYDQDVNVEYDYGQKASTT